MLKFKTFNKACDDSKYIRFCVFCDEQGVKKNHEIDNLDDNIQVFHIVAYENSKPVATCRFYREDGDMWHAGRIAVLKEHRKKGYGRAVLEQAEKEMKMHGAKSVFISAQTQAQKFYEALGYKAYGDIYPEEDIPHIAMKKFL